MASRSCGTNLALRGIRVAAASFALILACQVSGSGAEDKQPSACTEDAMIVFDASGSMSGNQTLGIPNSRTYRRSAIGARSGLTERHQISPCGPRDLWAWAVQPVQRQTQSQANSQRDLPGDECRERPRSGGEDAAHTGHRRGGGGARLPFQTRGLSSC
jgi:hypothetical protein